MQDYQINLSHFAWEIGQMCNIGKPSLSCKSSRQRMETNILRLLDRDQASP